MKKIFFLISLFCAISLVAISSPKATFTVSITDSGCGNYWFTLIPMSGSVVDSIQWSGDDRLGGKGVTTKHHYRGTGSISGDSFFYYVIGSNHFGAVYSDSGYIHIPPYVQISLPGDTLLCDSSPTKIKSIASHGTPPYTYLWSNGDINSYIIPKITQDTTFWVDVTDNGGNGCMNADTIHIKFAHNVPMGGSIVKHGKDTLYSTCTSKYTNWYLNDNLIAFHQKYVLITQPGKYEAACVDSICESGRAIFLGIEDNSKPETSFSLYPNPANLTLTLSKGEGTNPANAREGMITITDVTGRTLKTCEVFKTSQVWQMDISTFSTGIYFLKYQDGERVWNAKFIKQ